MGRLSKAFFQREIGNKCGGLFLSFGRLRQEDGEFDTVSLGCRVRTRERGRKVGGEIRKGEGGRRVEQEYTHAQS